MSQVASIETITPDQARELLKNNAGNRRIREAWVEALSKLMLSGAFTVTHQGIAIGNNGVVLDGQHRLLAIVRAGRPCRIMVTRGMDKEKFKWIDAGKSRSAPDRIHLVSDQGINAVACSITAFYLRCAQGKQSPTTTEIEDVFLDLTDSILFAAAAWLNPVKSVTKRAVGAALACYHSKHPIEASAFCESYMTGAMLAEGNPVLTLREAISSNRARSEHDQYWKAIAAMRAHLDKRNIRNLSAATADFQGNEYNRLKWERSDNALKARATRRANNAART